VNGIFGYIKPVFKGDRRKTMKDGYIQSKISELDELLKILHEKERTLEIQLKVIEDKIINFNDLFAKVNDVERFQNSALEKLRNSNRELSYEFTEAMSQKVQTIIDGLMNKKILDALEKRKKEKKTMCEPVYDALVYSNKQAWIIHVLLHALVDKGIISPQESDGIIARAMNSHKKDF
jgi:uncharacterized protein YoxC